MKSSIAAVKQYWLVWVLGVSLLCAGAAGAQTSSLRWTDPTGTWSLDLRSSEWGYDTGLGPGDKPAELVLLAAPARRPPESEVRLCFAEEHNEPLASGLSDAEIRRYAEQIDLGEAERVLRRIGTPRLTEARLTHTDVDGVAVADLDAVSHGRRRLRARIFVVPVGGRPVLSVLKCIWSRDMPARRVAEVEAIPASLRIRTGGAAP